MGTTLVRHPETGWTTQDGRFWVRRYGKAWAVYDKRGCSLHGGNLLNIVVNLEKARAVIDEVAK